MPDAISCPRGNNKIQPVARRMGIRRRQNLHHIAILNLRSQGRHSPVDSCAGTGISDFRMDRISEVNRCCTSGQLNSPAHGCKGVDILWIEIEFQRVEKIARVLNLLRPLHEGPQRLQGIILVVRSPLIFFVLPMGSDPFFSNLVHLKGSDLDLERLPFCPNRRSVKRSVEIIPWGCNPILNSSRYWLPVVMYHAEGRIAVANLIWSDNADSNQIVNLIETDSLSAQLFPN